MEVKLESSTEEGSNQTGRKELPEVSKDNEGVPGHKKARSRQVGGVEKGYEDDKEPIEEQEKEQVELEPMAVERADKAEIPTDREPRTEEVAEESKNNEGLSENIKAGTSQ